MEYYVYIVRAGDFIKIGYSGNVEQRIKILQSHNPLECQLLYKITYDCEDEAKLAEHNAHVFASEYSVRGEWFVFDELFLVSIVTELLSVSKKKVIQVDEITHRMIKELAAANGLTIHAYLMQLAFKEKAKNERRKNEEKNDKSRCDNASNDQRIGSNK